MITKYDDSEDDILINPKKEILKLACCDCGLIHQFEFRVMRGIIRIDMRRDNRATGQFRRHNYEYVKIT